MKSGVFGCCVLVLVLATSSATFAQAPPSAATVLANVQQFYAGTNQLSAAFRQTTTNATFGTSQISDGHAWVVKPSDFRWDYLTKRHGSAVLTKSFVFDGTTLWFVDHDDKRITEIDSQGSALPEAVAFLTGGNALSSKFAVALIGSASSGTQSALMLELTPKQPSAACKELYLVVDPADWHVRESIVVASNGDKNDFKFYQPNLSGTVKPGWFTVNPSALPTYKVVKLNAQSAGSAATP